MDKNENSTPPEVVRDLVFFVARAFYEPIHIVLLQALTKQIKKITDIDLSNKTNLPYRTVCAELNYLVSEMLVCHEHEYIDKKDCEFFYLNYDTFINVVRLRMESLKDWVEEQVKEKQVGYYCIKCNQGFDEFDIVKFMDFTTGKCICPEDGCDGEIIEDVDEYKERTGSSIPMTTLFNGDLNHIMILLEKTKKYIVPKRDRCNINAIITTKEAVERNKNFREMEEISKKSGGIKYNTRLETFLSSKKEGIKIQLNEEKNKKMAETTEENTPFFLKQNKESLASSADSQIQMEREKRKKQKEARSEKFNNVSSSELSINFKRLLLNKVNENEKSTESKMNEEKDDDDDDDFEVDKDVVMEDKPLMATFNDLENNTGEEEEEEEVYLTVNGIQKKFSEITEEDERKMSQEEYSRYCEIADSWE